MDTVSFILISDGRVRHFKAPCSVEGDNVSIALLACEWWCEMVRVSVRAVYTRSK